MLPSDFTSPFWEGVFRYSTLAAALFGALAMLLAFVSVWTGYEITTATRKQAAQKIADADTQLAQAQDRIAASEQAAAASELETERLRTQVSWRDISAADQDKFKTYTAVLPKGHVTVECMPHDPEARNYAQVLCDLLHQAGYDVDHNFNPMLPEGFIPFPVEIHIKSPDTEPSWAQPLQQALEFINIAAEGRVGGAMVGGDNVVIFIGSKREGGAAR